MIGMLVYLAQTLCEGGDGASEISLTGMTKHEKCHHF